jgi:protein-S-isoprenylcysteine O-methyltransferase Ste14
MLWWNLLKTAVFTVLAPGMVAGVAPLRWIAPRAAGPDGWRWVGLVPLTLGVAIYLWCAWDFAATGMGTPAPIDAPKILVVRGLYRFLRNPMYAGVLLVLAGESLLLGSTSIALYGAAVASGFHLFVTLYEEPSLRSKFGASYEAYCQRVSRWIPGSPNGQGPLAPPAGFR